MTITSVYHAPIPRHEIGEPLICQQCLRLVVWRNGQWRHKRR